MVLKRFIRPGMNPDGHPVAFYMHDLIVPDKDKGIVGSRKLNFHLIEVDDMKGDIHPVLYRQHGPRLPQGTLNGL